MKPIRPAILVATAYLLVYALFTQLDAIPEAVPIVMWFLSPVLVIWLVIHVLKHGEPSDKTWEDGHWYEDREQITDPS